LNNSLRIGMIFLFAISLHLSFNYAVFAQICPPPPQINDNGVLEGVVSGSGVDVDIDADTRMPHDEEIALHTTEAEEEQACPQGYVYDSKTGQCVSPMDDSYTRFTQQQEQQRQNGSEDIIAQFLDKSKYTSKDLVKDIDKTIDTLKFECTSHKQCVKKYGRGWKCNKERGKCEEVGSEPEEEMEPTPSDIELSKEDQEVKEKSEDRPTERSVGDIDKSGSASRDTGDSRGEGGSSDKDGEEKVETYVAYYVLEASFILENANVLEKKQYDELEKKMKARGRQTKIIAEGLTKEKAIKNACSKLKKPKRWRGCKMVAFLGDIRMCIDKLKLKNQDYPCNFKVK